MARTNQMGKLALRYANALLQAVQAEQGTEGPPTPAQRVALKLLDLASVWTDTNELSLYILDPKFPKEERLSALLVVAERLSLPDVAQRFIKVLFNRERIAILPGIATAFFQLADEAAGVVQVSVTTARTLPNKEVAALEQKLHQQINGLPVISWHVDPSIIGGLIVRYAGKVLDGSVKGKLERLERSLVS